MIFSRLIALGICAAAAASTLGQHTPQNEPPEGEWRLNKFQYPGTHNSYQRQKDSTVNFWSLPEQTDIFGFRHLELDVRWLNTLPPPPDFDVVGNFLVSHFCGDFTGEAPLEFYLAQLSSSEAITGPDHSFVIVNLETIVTPSSDPDDFQLCYDAMPTGSPPNPPNSHIEWWQYILQERIKAHIPEERIYTPEEFINIDNLKWPSQQELLRRGKSIAFTAQSAGFTGPVPISEAPHIFFGHGQIDNAGDPFGVLNDVHIGIGDEFQVVNEGDRYISILYPFGNLCIFEGADFVFNGLATGYNFVTTYCVQYFAFLLDQRVHPPNPMFVTAGADDPNGIGTHLLPYLGSLGMLQALGRVGAHEDVKGKSRIEIIIQKGTYNIGDNVNPVDISECVRLESKGGLVTITNSGT